MDHWKRNGPPVYLAAAALMGWKPEAVKDAAPGHAGAPKQTVRAVDDLSGFMADFAAFGGSVN